MKRNNDRKKILRAIKKAGFNLIKNITNHGYELISENELLYPYERKVK